MKKVYAIFGATGGIGSALAHLIGNQTDRVYLLGRNQAKLEPLSTTLSQPYLLIDATDEGSVQHAIKAIIEKEGQLDGIASLIGSVFLKPLHLTTQKEFEEVLKINAVSAFCILKHGLEHMQSGSIVLTSSTASLIGLHNHEAIAAAKGAINSLLRSAAASYAHKKIRVNAVAPGLTRTNQTTFLTDNEGSLKASIKMHPLGRIAEPQEIASAVHWLLSDQSTFMTGNVIPIDGGLSLIK